MADAATTADAVRTDAGADHSFLRRRLHALATLSILFQIRLGAIG